MRLRMTHGLGLAYRTTLDSAASRRVRGRNALVFAIALAGSLAATPGAAQVIAVNDTYNILQGGNVNDPAPGVLANDGGSPIEAVKLTDPANGTATIDSNGGVSYTPTAGFSGQVNFNYLARDFFANESVATVTVNVNGIPSASPDSYSTDEDQTLNVNPPNGVLANDSDDQSLTAQLVSDVSDGSLTLNTNGSFNYAPDPGYFGSDSFTYRAVDNGTPTGQSAPVTVTITVNPVNDPPVASPDSYSTDEDQTLNVNPPNGVLANDSDPTEGDDISAQLVSDVSNGTLSLNSNGSFSYTPDLNFFGNDSFTYRAVDDGIPPAQSTPATVTITVVGVNDPPAADDDSYMTDEETTLNVNAANGLLNGDTDIDGDTLTVVNPGGLSVDANEGTLAVNANGSFTFTPAQGFSGTVQFTYQATDGTVPTNTATVTIVVAPINDPPVTTPDSYNTDEDTPLSVNAANGVLANDTDEEMDNLTAQLVAGTSSGSLTLNANGSFNYTPNPDFFGSDTFTYRAVDDGDPAPAQSPATQVTITVNSVNDAPIAADDTYATDEDTSLNVATNQGVLVNDSDADPGDVMSVQLVADASSGTLALNPNGSFTYTPDLDFNGTDTFTYVVSDDASPPLQSSEATVTITIAPVNDAPRPIAIDPDPPIPDQAVTENVPVEPPIDLAPFFVDPEGDVIYFTLTANPGLSGLPDGLMQSAPPPAAGSSQIVGIPTLGTSVRACDMMTGEGYVEVIASDGIDDADPIAFCLRVIEAGRTDLSLSIGASPSPALINESVTWTFTVENLSLEPVPNAAVVAQFAGQVPFTFASSPNCTVTPGAAATTVRCTGGPVEAEGVATIEVAGSSSQAGDVAVTATVEVDGPVPVETDESNNTANGALNIAEQLAPVAAQTIAVMDHRDGAAGDFNGEGFTDLAAATSSAFSTRVYPNTIDPADPNAVKHILSEDALTLGDQAPSNSIAAADVDLDGALDLVTANRAGQANVIFFNTNAGDGSFGFAPAPDALGDVMEVSNAVAVGDVNNDTLPDIVFANSSPNPLYLNQGGGVFMPTADATLGDDDSSDVLITDLFGDARAEIVFANTAGDATNVNGDATVYTWDGAAYVRSTIPTGPTTSVAAGDFDGDGRMDLVFGRAVPAAGGLPSNPVFLNTSTGATGQFFAAAQLGASPTNDVLVIDPDADGDLDIVSINATGGHQIYVNNGNGAFTLLAQQFVSPDARAGIAGNFSSDDRVDVAVIGPAGIHVFYNDGFGNIGAGDLDPPALTLLGQSRVELIVEAEFEDPGATALDQIDGDVTDRIVIDNPVDTAVLGTYTVTYNVTDRSGNAAVPVTRTVVVGARTGTGGGGGGAFGLGLALFLATLGAARHLGRTRSHWSP